jgi:hypothetical protein
MKEYKLPLLNKNKEITGYALVSKEDYELLNQYKWHKRYDGYVCGTINNKKWRLHRYIIIEILKNNINYKNQIDHINRDKLNNKRDNLRIVSNSENSRNKCKQINTSSKYIGVSYIKNKNLWLASININKKTIVARYNNEHHAAYQYNIWCQEYNLNTANLNIIPYSYLINFKLYKIKDKLNNLPTNIYFHQNKYQLIINNKYIGIYNTLKEAIAIKEHKLKELEDKKNNILLEQAIKRNNDNECIIEIFNNKKEKIAETIVDKNIYYDLIKYNWYLTGNKFIINNKLGLLHRYIMNYSGDQFIDHINNNSLDNRKENLRIVTHKQNSLNKISSIYKSSKYIGVCWNKEKNKWKSYITIEGKQKHLGYYTTEIQAAQIRDVATLKYFGEYGNINIK